MYGSGWFSGIFTIRNGVIALLLVNYTSVINAFSLEHACTEAGKTPIARWEAPFPIPVTGIDGHRRTGLFRIAVCPWQDGTTYVKPEPQPEPKVVTKVVEKEVPGPTVTVVVTKEVEVPGPTVYVDVPGPTVTVLVPTPAEEMPGGNL